MTDSNWYHYNELKPDAKGNVLILIAEGKKNKRGREEERDVSERIALGQVEWMWALLHGNHKQCFKLSSTCMRNK